jgi:hypothetical protein
MMAASRSAQWQIVSIAAKDQLLALVANKLGTQFIEVHGDTDLRQLVHNYVHRGEKILPISRASFAIRTWALRYDWRRLHAVSCPEFARTPSSAPGVRGQFADKENQGAQARRFHSVASALPSIPVRYQISKLFWLYASERLAKRAFYMRRPLSPTMKRYS